MPKANIPAILSTFIFCFLFWLLLTWSFALQELVAGVVVSLAVALFSARFFIREKPFHLFNPLRFLALLFYSLGTFLGELIKANWDVAKKALAPRLNINPGIVKVPVELESAAGQALLANSITLTPGTITMDIVEEAGKTYYYIHWLDVQETDGEKAGEIIKGRLERGIRRVFP